MSTYQGWLFLEVLKCLPTQIHNSFFLSCIHMLFLRESTQYMNEFQNIETMSTNLPSLHSEDHELDDVHISWTCQDYILATILFFSADINDAINLHKYCLFNIGEVRTVLRLWVRFPFVSNTDHGNKHSPVTRRHISGIAPQPPQWTMWHCLHQCVSFRFWFGMVASYQGN